MLPSRYYQIERAAERAASGEITPACFLEFLEQQWSEFSDGEEQMLRTDTSHFDVASDVEEGLKGIDLCIAALQRMAAFCEDDDAEHLEEGLEMMASGLEQLREMVDRNQAFLLELEHS